MDGVRAASTAAASVTSTKRDPTPNRRSSRSSRERVLPYRAFDATTSSPAPTCDARAAKIAPMPVPKAKPSAAPSISATASARAAAVGFAIRE